MSRPDDRRAEWLDAYLSAIVQRDLRDLANIERLAEIPALLASLAARVRAPLNKADVGSSVGIPRSSLDRYLTLLEHVFLVRRLPAWHSNRIKQITKAPKLLIADSALLMHLLRADRTRLERDDALLGTVLEPDLTGVDLLIEDVSEHHYRIDRTMFHVTGSPNVRKVARLRLGRVGDIPENDPDFGRDEVAIVEEWCRRAGIPFGGRADIGHDVHNRVVPFLRD